MEHSLESVPLHWQKYIFWPSLAACLLLIFILNGVGAPLQTPVAPVGIISFELAGNPERADEILASWDSAARVRAGFSLGLDYLFMLAYSTAIAMGCLWAARGLRARCWPFVRLGTRLAWGQWLAALFDALENVALVILLLGPVRSPWPQIAQWSAWVKFSLIFLGLVYSFLGAAARLTPKRQRQLAE